MLDTKDNAAMDPAPIDVGARFTSREAAERAVRRLEAEGIAVPAQVEILAGEGRMHVARAAESRATRKALVRWHVVLGAAGLLLGTLLGIFAWYSGAPIFGSEPVLVLFVFAGFGAVAGLLLGGLFALRPPKDWIAAAARDDALAGDYPVVVHATDREQAHKARESLTRSDGEPYLSAG
jgi:anti-sigma-K factor RskA